MFRIKLRIIITQTNRARLGRTHLVAHTEYQPFPVIFGESLMSCLKGWLIQSCFIVIMMVAILLSPEQLAACYTTQETDAAENNASDNKPENTEPASVTPDAGQDDLATLKKKWQDLDQQLAATEAQYRQATDPAVQATIKKQYVSLTEQASALVLAIKQAAEASFVADPSNQEAAKTLVGIMMNDVEFGRDQEALRIGHVLIKGNVDPAFFKAAAGADRLSIDSKELFDEMTIRQIEAKADDLPQVNSKRTRVTLLSNCLKIRHRSRLATLSTLSRAVFITV